MWVDYEYKKHLQRRGVPDIAYLYVATRRWSIAAGREGKGELMENAENYKNLANAIIAQAATDYRKSLKGRRVDGKRIDCMSPIDRMIECEKFFRSPLYRILTSVDCEYIMGRIKKECQSETSNIHNQKR